MTNKMTKKEMFVTIQAVVEQYGNQDMVDFIDHEIELLNRKSSNKKPTKTQTDNIQYKAEILSVLTDVGATVTEIQSKSDVLAGLSNQKVSALLRQLVESKEAVKTIDKKKSYFTLGTVEETEDE